MSTHHDVEELLGAYALDAVDPDEARLVEAHLAECPRCRAEVAAHREVAALLTSGSSEPAPEGVWDRIAGELGDTPPPVPLHVDFNRGRDRRRTRVVVGLAAAAVVAILALMTGVLVDQRAEVGDLRDELAAQQSLEQLIEAPGTQVVDLHSDGGTAEARAIVGEDGDSILLAAQLPVLRDDRAYQLWGLPEGRDAMVSLGVLGADPDRSPFHVEGEVTALAISEEPEEGSTQPTSETVVAGEFA